MADRIDDRDGFIWMDGKFLPWRDTKVHVLTHGLHYASSVFEGERAYNGKIFKMKEHHERLVFSAKTLGMTIPYTIEQLNQAALELLQKNKLTNAYIRPLAWRGSEQLGVSSKYNDAHVAIAAWEWPSYYPKEMMEKGMKMKTAQWRRPDPKTAPCHAKAAGLYMICTLAKNQVDAEGYQDALMLDYRGYVAEASSANIFFVMDGKLHTPDPDCFLNGLTRQTVIELAKESGIEVIVRHIKPEEMKNATECFLTGTAAEVMPVGQIDDYHFKPGKITQTLREKYTALVNA